jgi:hypothetical protein
MKTQLKPDFIATARAQRRHHARWLHALAGDKRTHLIASRILRLYRLYKSQIKIPA